MAEVAGYWLVGVAAIHIVPAVLLILDRAA